MGMITYLHPELGRDDVEIIGLTDGRRAVELLRDFWDYPDFSRLGDFLVLYDGNRPKRVVTPNAPVFWRNSFVAPHVVVNDARVVRRLFPEAPVMNESYVLPGLSENVVAPFGWYVLIDPDGFVRRAGRTLEDVSGGFNVLDSLVFRESEVGEPRIPLREGSAPAHEHGRRVLDHSEFVDWALRQPEVSSVKTMRFGVRVWLEPDEERGFEVGDYDWLIFLQGEALVVPNDVLCLRFLGPLRSA